MEDSLDEAVNDILSQLKDNTALARKVPTIEEDLQKEDLEKYIISTSGKLINKTMGIIDNVNDYISSAPEAKDVTALAELLKAAATSIESLNKVYTSIERNKTVKEVKQMDIDSREKINVSDNATFLLSRKEVMQELLKKADEPELKIVDI